jgi:hypothetical protein
LLSRCRRDIPSGFDFYAAFVVGKYLDSPEVKAPLFSREEFR